MPGSRNAGLHVSILLVVQQPDPNQPKPEGSQMVVLRGEPLAEGSWPPSLLAALQQWGTTQPSSWKAGASLGTHQGWEVDSGLAGC